MPVENLIETFGGSVGFLIAFVVALAALLAWVVFQVWAYRRRRNARRDMRLRSFTVSDRDRWISDLRRIASGYLPAEDEKSLRGLHQGLGRQMRAIVSERSGRDISSWSVSDISQHRALAEVAELLVDWERPSFAPDPRAHGLESVDRAIAVVSRW
ncbi:hypothetical protein VR010_08135 [Actinomycetaceae bacterium L2_0104]